VHPSSEGEYSAHNLDLVLLRSFIRILELCLGNASILSLRLTDKTTGTCKKPTGCADGTGLFTPEPPVSPVKTCTRLQR
jgi:hypothetical protein